MALKDFKVYDKDNRPEAKREDQAALARANELFKRDVRPGIVKMEKFLRASSKNLGDVILG